MDDAPYIRELLTVLLPRGPFDVVGEAHDGHDAVNKATNLKPDLILMDIVMPHKSGIQAAKEILEKQPQTRIVMMSTVDQDLMSMKALESGALELIHKPFRAGEVLEILTNIMNKGQSPLTEEKSPL